MYQKAVTVLLLRVAAGCCMLLTPCFLQAYVVRARMRVYENTVENRRLGSVGYRIRRNGETLLSHKVYETLSREITMGNIDE